MNTTMPRNAVTGAGVVMAIAAAAGLYLGVSRSIAAGGGAEELAALPSTPIVNAKPIVAQTPALDEATVRRMAREEAQALIVPRPAPVVKKPAADDDDESPSSTETDTPTVPLAPAKQAVPAPSPQ